MNSISGLHATLGPDRMILVVIGLAVLAGLALLPWIIGRRRGSLDPLEFVYVYSLLYFIEYGGRMLWLLVRPEALAAQTPHPSAIHAVLVPTVFLAAAGLGAYYIGYYAVPSRAPARHDVRPGPAHALTYVAMACYAVGFAARLPLWLRGWFMGFAAASFADQVPPLVHSANYLGVLSTVGYAMALAAFFQSDRPAWLGWVLWALIVPLELVNAFLAGSKTSMLGVVVIMLVTLHYLRYRLPVRALAMAAALFLLILVPAITVYRNVASAEQLHKLQLPAGLPVLVERVTARIGNLSLREYLDASLGVGISRFIGIDALASVIAAIPDLTGYLFGDTLLWMVRILVPTTFWSAKYEAVTATLAPVPLFFGFADFSRGGLSITQPAELYWNFGSPGVLVGMALIGALQGWIVEVLRRPGDPGRIALYAVSWPWFVLSFEGWFYAVYGNLLRILTLGSAAVWVASRLRVGRVRTP